MNTGVKQAEALLCCDAGVQEVPIVLNKKCRQKYRAALDYSGEVREYFDLVVRHVLKERYVIPTLEICDPQDMPYSGLCDFQDDTITLVNKQLWEPLIHHELAHYVYYHSGSGGFTARNACGRHDVVFACTCAAFHLFMKKDAGYKPKSNPRLPKPDGLTYMSAYDVWEETDAPLTEFNGLLFARVFYDCLKYMIIGNTNKQECSRLSIGDIPCIAAHAKVIYLGSLTLNDLGYVDTQNGNREKMRLAVESALVQRAKCRL